MTTANGNQNPQTPPDVDELMQQLEELGADPGAPAEGQDGTQFSDTDEGRKQSHAFATQRRLLQQAKAVIRSLKDKPNAVSPQAPAQAGSRGDATAQAELILSQLQLEAMQNTGIANVAHPVVVLEINRLYSEKVQQLRTRSEAGGKAPLVFQTVAAMPQFKMLTDADRTEIQSQISRLAPEAQADERTVKSVFSLYLGENYERLSALPSGPQRGGSEGSDAGAAAASGVRSRGRGVPPGPANGGGSGGASAKAPDAKESAEMRSLGLDPFVPADVARYREASKRRGQYAGG